ncbi:FecR family protein [Pedobacter nyackensis]|uniref:FecR family protein n=1 Tax=Pedobacter nyackensis TaxID=475255 RepID=UPI00292D4FD8|nr:FecR domain-containing protein [Pedobacter nyackensis]
MGKTNTNVKKDLDQQATAWFYKTDDKLPFDAFGDINKENRIRNEIFNQVNKEINQRKSIKLFFVKAAAVLILAASIGVAVYRPANTPEVKNNQTWTTYSSQPGETKTIILTDQSEVTLRPGTKLYIPATFTTDSKRVVKLEGGEAYFSIARNPKRPFLVQSGQITTQVLGTAFNIKNKSDASEIEVAVSHGKVQVNDQTHRLAYLTKGELIRFDTRSGAFKLDHINTSYVAAWNKSAIELDNVSFKELAYIYNSRYSTELLAPDVELAQLRYTLTIRKTDDAQRILKIIAKIHGLHTRTENGKIILYR